MNEGLQYHLRTSLRNMAKRTLKRPLKSIGIALLGIYFLFLPFFMRDMIINFGFDSPFGFVLIATVAKFYVVMPSTLSYFKRNGVVFKKPDANLMFSTPISPKQILIYALFKQAYMSVIMDISFFIAAIVIFNVPVGTAVLYFIVMFVFSNLSQYSLALIMYGSEDLSDKNKQSIKWLVYGVMILVTLWTAFYFFSNGLSLNSAMELINQPFVLLIPIFGWELGWLHSVIMGPTVYSIVASILFFITALSLAWYAYKMACTGEYFEDALNFANRQAKIVDKQGDVSIKEMFGKEKKTFKTKAVLKGLGAKVIFSRQFMERTRSQKFFFSLGDYVMLLVGVGGGIAARFSGFESEFFFTAICGFFIYFLIFFTPSHSWRNDFDQYYIYVMPETMLNKLFYSTLFDNFISLMRSIFLTIPFGLIVGASISHILLAIITQILMKAMVSYLSIFFSIYIGAKIGKQFGQILTMLLTVLILLVPIILIISNTFLSTLIVSTLISLYSIIFGIIFLVLCTKVISNVESLRD